MGLTLEQATDIVCIAVFQISSINPHILEWKIRNWKKFLCIQDRGQRKYLNLKLCICWNCFENWRKNETANKNKFCRRWENSLHPRTLWVKGDGADCDGFPADFKE